MFQSKMTQLVFQPKIQDNETKYQLFKQEFVEHYDNFGVLDLKTDSPSIYKDDEILSEMIYLMYEKEEPDS